MPIDHFPTPLQPLLEKLRAWLITDASALLVLAWSSVLHAVSYMFLHSSISHPAERWMGLQSWSLVWGLVAILTLAGAVWHKSVWPTVGTGAAIGLHCLWAFSHLGGAMFYGFDRGYIGFAAYSTTVLLMFWALWRGSRSEIHIKEMKELPDGD